MKQQRKKWVGLLSLFLVICIVIPIFPNAAVSGQNAVYKDGVYDNWIQDTNTVKGEEVLEVTDDGWLRVKSCAANGNNPEPVPPAVFVDSTYEMGESGFFEATFRVPSDANDNRFGIYLGYAAPKNALLIGYDAGGWFWQRYGAQGNPWYNGPRLAAPAPGTDCKIRLEWAGKKLTKATFNGINMFVTSSELDFSDISELGNHIALKTGSYGTSLTEMLIRDIHYSGQAEAETYEIRGTVTDGAEPLSDVFVYLSDDKKTFTNAQGEYVIASVPEGKYKLLLGKDGYIQRTQTISLFGNDIVVPTVEMEKFALGTAVISSGEMAVTVDTGFPRVINYIMTDSGKEFYGQATKLDSMFINGIDVKAELIDATLSEDKIVYEMLLKNTDKYIDAVITAEMSVEKNTLAFNITNITNNLNNLKYPIETIEIPNHSLISVRSTQEGANLKTAVMSTNTTVSGDRHIEINDSVPAGTAKFMYAFISNRELSAGMYSNSDIGTRGSGADNNRVTLNVAKQNGYTTSGLSSSAWYYHRKVSAKGSEYVIKENAMPSVKVVITDDRNGDGQVDWQDGAIAFRSIMNNPYKYEEVPELVSHRIAMNFGGQAQNPFLMTLDNVKKVALHTDGLGQSIILKGYGSEGHDSGHPDYGNIGKRMGGAKEMNLLMKEGARYGARFGVHINASEMYPEAKAFSDNLVRRNADGSLRYGWNWLDQGVGIDGLFDLASEQRAKRLDELKALVGDNLDFIYLDVWGNNTSGQEDAWETKKISDQITKRGWRLAFEWGFAGESDSTFQHWAADLTYGGYTLKGINSEVIRFLRNHQKDSWIADYPKYNGAAVAPLLGGYNMKDFEGWQGRNDYDAYINNIFTNNISTKFLQHYKIMKWVNGNPVTIGGKSWTPEMEITLRDDEGANTIIIKRESNEYNAENPKSYRSRVMTLNGKVILKGALKAGDNSDRGDESYLIPWYWDSETGKRVSSYDEKLYHFNTLGGDTSWELPEGWDELSYVVMYKLTDLGKAERLTIPVFDGKVTIKADAGVPYVIYKKPNATNMNMTWSVGMNIADSGFNSGYLNNWIQSGKGNAEIALSQYSNQMLKLDGEVAMTQTLTGLEPGQKYAAYVGVDNRSNAKAWITVNSQGNELAANYTEKSIAKNYVQADPHNTNSATVNGSSYFQNMYVFFTAPSDGSGITLTLKREDGEESTYFDNIRIVETGSDNIKAIDKDGYVTKFAQNFEDSVQGVYPFVIGGAEGVQDNRTHLSELHAPYTQAGWDVKKMDDVLSGNWSLKVNGLTNRNRLVYQTIPQNFRFKPGVAYSVSFDYQLGSAETYTVATGTGETYIVPEQQRMIIPMSLGKTANFKFTITGDESGQTWFGIYSTTTGPDLQGTSGNVSNFGGYKDFVMDNLVIEAIGSVGNKDQLNYLISYAEKLAGGKELPKCIKPVRDFFALALEEAIFVRNDEIAVQEEVDKAWQKLYLAVGMVDYEWFMANKINLIDAVRLAESIELYKYKDEGKTLFLAALKTAKALCEDENLTTASQSKIDSVYETLMDAMLALRLKFNTSLLESLLNKALAVESDKYTPESLMQLNKVIDSAQAVLADPASQEEIDGQAAALKTAMDSLVEKDTVKDKEQPSTGDNNNNNNNNGGQKVPGESIPTTGDSYLIASGILMLFISAACVLIFRRKRTDSGK